MATLDSHLSFYHDSLDNSYAYESGLGSVPSFTSSYNLSAACTLADSWDGSSTTWNIEQFTLALGWHGTIIYLPLNKRGKELFGKKAM